MPALRLAVITAHTSPLDRPGGAKAGGLNVYVLELAHELAWSRPAKPIEAERGTQFLEQYRRHLAAVGLPAERLELETWTSYARILLSANEFVYLD